MRGKIALEEHVSTPENNRLWDSSGEAGRNGTEYMKDVERRLLDRSIQLEEMAQRHLADIGHTDRKITLALLGKKFRFDR